MGKASRRKRNLRGQMDPLHDHVREQTERLSLPGDELDDNELACDFCSSSGPRYMYPTDDADPTGFGWAACDACHRLIEEVEPTALVRRTVRQMRQRYPVLDQVNSTFLENDFRDLHNIFQSHRNGAPVLLSGWVAKHGPPTNRGELRRRMERLFQGGAGAGLGTVAPTGDAVLRHVPGQEGTESYYLPEGFTSEQLADPRTIEYIMERMQAERPVPNVPLTAPVSPVIRQWVGARSFLQAMSAIYGDCPREDDIFPPRAPMVMAQLVLEPALRAHPLVLEPQQLNAIDAGDWSFAEAVEYAKMAHLPFEPLYLDFGGHQPVMVDLADGPCRLYGAVVWRSGFFKEPTLAVAPIGGFDYLTGPFADARIAEGIAKEHVIGYVGNRPGKDIAIGDATYATTRSQIAAIGGLYRGRMSRREFEQWRYQPAGICWFGVSDTAQHLPEGPGDNGSYVSGIQQVVQGDKTTPVPLVFSTGQGVADALGEERLHAGTQAMVLSGLHDPNVEDIAEKGTLAITEPYPGWNRIAQGATEMVARLAERALLGLYFVENAPVRVEQVALSRPERREQERNAQKGRKTAQVASIIVIDQPRSDTTRPLVSSDRNYTHRWERRGHFAHYHENNRHYQNRPDLVRPCHKCAWEYEQNEQARRDGLDLPYPHTESPDCIKHWREPTVCGDPSLPLKKKVRIRRNGPPTKEAA